MQAAEKSVRTKRGFVFLRGIVRSRSIDGGDGGVDDDREKKV